MLFFTFVWYSCIELGVQVLVLSDILILNQSLILSANNLRIYQADAATRPRLAANVSIQAAVATRVANANAPVPM